LLTETFSGGGLELMKTFTVNKRTKELFDANPKRFIKRAIKKFVRTSPANRLNYFGGEPIFEEPLVGFADGDDPLFNEYKKVVHESHFLPREILGLHLGEKPNPNASTLESVSVISFAFPISRETLKVNAREKEGPSLRWNHTRWKGQDFIVEFSNYLVLLLEEMGACTLAPELSPFFKILVFSDGFASNWSQRHMAYAAGLGTFSLNDGFITTKGLAMRCGSVVTNLKLEPSTRPYVNHLANCLSYATGKCGECISRCPGGAISEKGHDKLKCFAVLYEKQKPWLEGTHGPGFIGTYAGCGLCQTGVPCAWCIPVKKTDYKAVNSVITTFNQ
jgi:epoxyqueuosine reductase